jgi:uncharacterized YigZ family protein
MVRIDMNTSDSERYPIPAGPARVELRIVNSRFIGSADYTPTVEAAKDFIAQVRTDLPGATHHAYAYCVGYGSSVIAGMSDAGEPSGTAGRPMLAVVRGSGLGDITVVVTRYFGGTLLGTGGLVHAYSDTTREVLAALERTERVEVRMLLVTVDYGAYEMVRRVLEEHQASFIDEAFATNVTLTVALPVTMVANCRARLASITAGQADMQEL